MPALLLSLLPHCAGNIEMDPTPYLTPTPTNCLRRSEWKLPLRGRITYRNCRQPKLPNFLYSSNTTSWRLMRRANNNCLRLVQWNANGISGKITELLTFLHSNSVNIAANQEAKLTIMTKRMKTPTKDGQLCDLTAKRNIGGDLLMVIKYTFPFVDNTATLQQSADPHLEQSTTVVIRRNASNVKKNFSTCMSNVPISMLIFSLRSILDCSQYL